MNQEMKIMIFGPHNSGKTSLLNKITKINCTVSEIKPTVGIEYGTCNLNNNKLHFFDISGQEKFLLLLGLYIKDINYFVLVYDLTSKSNMKDVIYWINYIQRYEDINNVPILLVGNKLDCNNIYHLDFNNEIFNYINIVGHLKISAINETDYNLLLNCINNYIITNKLI